MLLPYEIKGAEYVMWLTEVDGEYLTPNNVWAAGDATTA